MRFLFILLCFASPALAEFDYEQRREGSLQFLPMSQGLPASEEWRGQIDVADMNGDSHPDILSTSPRSRSGPPIIFLGSGSGKWVRWRELQLPPYTYRYGAIKAADFDADGLLDIALAMNGLPVQVLRNKGNGRFIKWLQAGAVGDWAGGRLHQFWSRSLGVTDFDGDSQPDLLALSAGPLDGRRDGRALRSDGIRIFSFQGEEGWSYRLLNTKVQYGSSLLTGDVFKSGRGDILASSMVPGERKLLHYFDTELHQWLQVELWPLPIRAVFLDTAILDLNQDDRMDLVVSYQRISRGSTLSGVDVLFQDKFGSFEPYHLIEARRSYDLFRLASGDFDGDTRPELIAFDLQGTVKNWEFNEGVLSYWDSEFPARFEKCWIYEALGAEVIEGQGTELVTGFGSLEIPAQDVKRRCPNKGALQVWRLSKKTESTE